MLDTWGAPSPETLACFLYGAIESWFSETFTKDVLSGLEHMPETRNDVGFMRFLLEIHETLEVGTVFRLVRCGSERNIDVFTSHPFIEIVFDLSKAKLDMIFNLPNKDLPPSGRKRLSPSEACCPQKTQGGWRPRPLCS